MIMDQIPGRMRHGRGTSFLTDPSSTSAASVVDWATIHALVIGRIVKCDYLYYLCLSHMQFIMQFIMLNFISLNFHYLCMSQFIFPSMLH